jgi:hypothetical protein
MNNKKQILAVAAAVIALGVGSLYAQNGPSAANQRRAGYVDDNGDGICDITGVPIGSGAQAGRSGQLGNGNRKGPGDGTGNQGVRPQDGTGYGAGSGKMMGPQDGSRARFGKGNGSNGGNNGRKGGRR